MFFHIHNVYEIAVLVEFVAFHLQFKDIMMRVGKILRSPVSADEKVSCYEIPLYCECIHFSSPVQKVSGLYTAHDELSIFTRDGHRKTKFVYLSTVIEVRTRKGYLFGIKMLQ